MNNTIGILGGMGPLATCDLYKKIISVTKAERDQDHVRVCIDSNSRIPDRTAAILYNGTDPVPEMVRSAIKLENMGADVLVMPCNTAHYFYDRLLPFINVPFINMLDSTATAAAESGIKKAGLLATSGTIEAGVYQRAFESKGISLEYPDSDGQRAVMGVIYDGIKKGNLEYDLSQFLFAIQALFRCGCQTVILGCTELPVAFETWELNYPHLDPTLILAMAVVRFLGYETKTSAPQFSL